MTPHSHTTRVKGCYRCELRADEAFDDTTTTSRLRQASITVDAEALARIIGLPEGLVK